MRIFECAWTAFQKLLTDSGLKNVEVIGDIALSLANDKINEKKKKKKIAINIGTSSGKVWGNEAKILETISNCVKLLLKNGWDIAFFPVINNDVVYIKKAISKIGVHIPIFMHYKSITKSLNFLSQCDVMIGEKLHSVILAHCVYTPAIMLEYRPKCLDYMTSIGMENFNIKTDEMDVDNIIFLMNKIYNNIYYYQKIIYSKISYYKKLQFNRAREIIKLLK